MGRVLLLSLVLCACGGARILDEAPDGGGPDAGPVCGNGIKEKGEECDNGSANGPNTGCERDCTRSCIPADPVRGDAHCNPHDSCKGSGFCTADFLCEYDGGLPDGTSCGSGDICRGNACQTPVCGDGFVTPPEECDDGINNGSLGCDSQCKFVCVSTDPSRNCSSTNPCQSSGTCNDDTHLCAGVAQLPDGTSCGSGLVCRGGQCLSNNCGNGHLDPGEQCDPPNGVTCDNECQNIVCGDGKRGGQEQCDDGNTANLDGCSSSCKFEEAQRANKVTIVFGTDSFCTANALGGAIGSNAQSTLQGEIDTSVDGGTLNVMFEVMNLGDTTGQNGTLKLGAVTGDPYPAPPLETYRGTKDTDWWYQTGASGLDGSRVPTSQLQASIANTQLQTTAPGRMNLVFVLGAGPVQLAGSGVKVKASIGASSAPSLSQHGSTPGHISTERLDPSLRSFGSMTNGELCGNIAASSLRASPVADSLQSGGSVSCNEGYGSGNSMLDVIVNGCTHTFFGIDTVTILAKTQPDQVDPQAAAAGAGGPYQLSGNPVSSCKDKNGAVQNLTTCLAAAAFSSALQFTTDRVILK